MLLINSFCPPDLTSQCSRLPIGASSATRAVCSYISTVSAQDVFESLATLLSDELNHVAVCMHSAPVAMKGLLLAISKTESRDPRDPAATATNFLNTCFSSCSDSSISVLLAVATHSERLSESGTSVFASFCTNPVMALLWQHASNSPRECSDSLITIVSDQIGVTPCALRSLLPTYVALCDAHTIQCEETILAMPAAEAKACDRVIETSDACSSDCAAFVRKFASGSRCLERLASYKEVYAHAVNQTCSDSGEHDEYLLTIDVCS